MSALGRVLDLAFGLRTRLDRIRLEHRWERYRARGMHIGRDVLLPASTWIDPDHCHLIHIGDHTGFGEQCLILAHDAQMDEYLDAARIGRVLIRESCHIGARSVILAGIEMGPRTLVGAGSVVSQSLPADSVCAGSPARVICGLEEYLERHRRKLAERPRFDYDRYDVRSLTPERRAELVAAVADGDAYITGGRAAELRGQGGSHRTPLPVGTPGAPPGPGDPVSR
jgi:maltose O-acetyltransferase